MKTGALRRNAESSTTSAPSGEFRLDDYVGYFLRRAHQRHTALFQEEIGELDLTPTQFAALVKIGQLGQVSQNQLGRLTAMDPATIQGVIQRLETRKLIAREPDPADRRCTLLSLSAAGTAIMENAVARVGRVGDAALSPLSAAERQAFLALLGKLI
jgi:DNA-binding MarR family transcriptional regulator